MLYLPFTFRDSTEEEIDLFSEEFSNVYRLNPEVKFTTAELHKEKYVIFATKEENDETRILFFLIFDHPLKEFKNVYHLFCAFIKEVTHVEPKKENLEKKNESAGTYRKKNTTCILKKSSIDEAETGL